MNDGTTDTMRVVFPAAERFVRVGRVAMAGLALRLECRRPAGRATTARRRRAPSAR
ncbi:MAG: hypothetical protein R2710_09920 [Acidimicrobiales bacterium]